MPTKLPADFPTVSFRSSVSLNAQLVSRAADTKTHTIARRDLERYYALLENDLKKLDLSRGEVLLILDACGSAAFEPTSTTLLWAIVDTALTHGSTVAAKWNVDGPALVTRLRSLPTGQTYALADAIERSRNTLAAHDGNAEAAARAAGLLRSDT